MREMYPQVIAHHLMMVKKVCVCVCVYCYYLFNTFIQKGHIKLIKCDSKCIYNVTNK